MGCLPFSVPRLPGLQTRFARLCEPSPARHQSSNRDAVGTPSRRPVGLVPQSRWSWSRWSLWSCLAGRRDRDMSDPPRSPGRTPGWAGGQWVEAAGSDRFGRCRSERVGFQETHPKPSLMCFKLRKGRIKARFAIPRLPFWPHFSVSSHCVAHRW